MNTPKVVSGIDAASLAAVQAFYDTLVDAHRAGLGAPQEAELTKLLENTFRHVNIALVNELAMFARDLGIDIWEAIDAASTKPFGFMRFTPGPGVGGHCLPIDPCYLSWRVQRRSGRSFRFVELANDVNDHMPDYVVRRLIAGAEPAGRMAVNGSRILLLGLAYKRNTGDARESPAVMVAERLVELGADVRAVDPYLEETRSIRGSPSSTSPTKRSPRPTRSCCSPTTTASISTSSWPRPATCSTRASGCRGPTWRGSEAWGRARRPGSAPRRTTPRATLKRDAKRDPKLARQVDARPGWDELDARTRDAEARPTALQHQLDDVLAALGDSAARLHEAVAVIDDLPTSATANEAALELRRRLEQMLVAQQRTNELLDLALGVAARAGRDPAAAPLASGAGLVPASANVRPDLQRHFGDACSGGVPAGSWGNARLVPRSLHRLLASLVHMLQRAWVGDMRAARMAGRRLAMAPMSSAEASPPAQAR